MNKSNFIISILIVILQFEGCKGISDMKNNFREYRVIKGDSVSYEMLAFTQYISNGLYVLNYSDSFYHKKYYLSTRKGFNNKVIFNQKDTQQLFLTDKKIYTFGKRDFLVYKFIENKGITDGEISLFWSPLYGIILERTNTWRNFEKLIRIGNKEQDDTISILCDIIFSDVNFYKNEVPDSMIKFVPPNIEDDQ